MAHSDDDAGPTEYSPNRKQRTIMSDGSIDCCNRCKAIATGSSVPNTAHVSSASNYRLYNQKNIIYCTPQDRVETPRK